MSTLRTRIGSLENTTRQAACLDVWDTLKENGIERGLEILRANGVPEHMLAEIESERENAHAWVREWRRATFGEAHETWGTE